MTVFRHIDLLVIKRHITLLVPSLFIILHFSRSIYFVVVVVVFFFLGGGGWMGLFILFRYFLINRAENLQFCTSRQTTLM